MSLADAISAARDVFFMVGMTAFGWKVRSWAEPLFDLCKRVNEHMDKVEKMMDVLLNNHIAHIQDSLQTLASRDHLAHIQDSLHTMASRDSVHITQTGPVSIVSDKPVSVSPGKTEHH